MSTWAVLNEIKSDCVSLLPSPANIFHHTKWENHIYIHKVMEKLILICHTTLVIAVEHCIGYVQSACTRLCWSIDKHLKTAVKNSIRWYFPLGVDRLNDPSTHICFTPAMQERGGGGCPNFWPFSTNCIFYQYECKLLPTSSLESVTVPLFVFLLEHKTFDGIIAN